MSYVKTELQGYLPVSGAETTIESVNEIPPAYFQHYISVNFYSDETMSVEVPPATGTALVKVSDTGDNFGTIASGTITYPIDATLGYDRPNMQGYIESIKVTFNDIAPAVGSVYAGNPLYANIVIHSYS